MPGTYIINFSDPSKGHIEILPMTQDTSTSLTMAGYRYPVYGEALWGNFLHLLENFASPSSPNSPVTGQIWVDTTTTDLVPKVWSDTLAQWIEIGKEISISETAPQFTKGLWYNPTAKTLNYWNGSTWVNTLCFVVANTIDYNEIVTDLNTILSKYGQATLATVATATLANWNALIVKVKTLAEYRQLPDHIVNRLTDVSSFDWCTNSSLSLFTMIRKFDIVNRALDQIAVAPYNSVDPACWDFTTPAGGTKTHTTPVWSELSHIASFAFTSDAAMQSFFQTGGKFVWNGVLTPSGAVQAQVDWQNFLASTPDITIEYDKTHQNGEITGVGVKDLPIATTGLGTVLFFRSLHTAYYTTSVTQTNAFLKVFGRKTTGGQIVITVQFLDPDPGDIGGTLQSAFTEFRVNSTCIGQALAWPLVTSSGTI